MNIPFARIQLTGNERKYIDEVLDSGWLTTAGKARQFEEKFADFVGAPFACAVNSGTAALHLALEASGVKPGDKVFVPSMTFTASAETIRYLSADPVFLDVEYGTNLITPEILKEAIEKHPDVKYLVIVHYGGQAARMRDDHGEGILDICERYGIKTIEDAAHAFPARLKGKMVGNLGDATCFSFYANKTITTGEGGMLVTKDEEIYRRAKLMRLHGINRDVWDRFNKAGAGWEYDVVAPGYKYNMPDLNAAIGLAQLEEAEMFRVARQKIAEKYLEALKPLSEVLDLPVTQVPFTDHAWHLFPVVLKENAPLHRNALIEKLAAAGIGTSVHYKPLHRMSYYRNRYDLNADNFPNTERTWKGNISLPIYPGLTEEELYYICHTIETILS